VAKKTPTVSVVLNCYNHELYVGEAIESVLGQTFGDLELILIDNGSTDGSRAVMERYDDPRIRRLFNDTNESLSRRLNQGMAAARGDYVAVLYSDDMMLPDKLERQVAMFANLPADYGVVYCPATSLNQQTGERWKWKSRGLSGDLMPAMLVHFYDGPPDMSSPLARRACFADCHWHDDLFGDGEAIWLRIMLRWKFRYDPVPTIVLRDHGSNMGKATQKNHDMALIILERLGDLPNYPAKYLPELNRLKATMCRNHAWIALRLGTRDTSWVFRQLRAAADIDVTVALHPRWLGALALAALPFGLREALNSLGRKLRGTRENTKLVTEF
jgi:glycosyltransferase involved in cell wall biosynthesis